MKPHLHALDSKDTVDAEAYDRFCNKQDRAYTVAGGVYIVCFYLYNIFYETNFRNL